MAEGKYTFGRQLDMFSARYISQELLALGPSVGEDHRQILLSRSLLPAPHSAAPAEISHK